MNSYKVDSPFAKPCSTGGLTCTLCQCHVKSAKVWTAHANGRVHRGNLIKSKRQTTSSTVREKRHLEEGDEEDVKKPKPTEPESREADDCVSIDDADKLPTDFFDSISEQASSSLPTPPEGEKKEDVEEIGDDQLPKGFFDKRMLDSATRSEQKDALDVEWENFQKEIKVDENAANEQLDEDLELMYLERSLEEIDHEMRGWALLNRWEIKVENYVANRMKPVNVPLVAAESTSDVEDEETLDDKMDWRSKEYF